MKEGESEQASGSCLKSQRTLSSSATYLRADFGPISRRNAALYQRYLLKAVCTQTESWPDKYWQGGERLEPWLEGGLSKWRVVGECRWNGIAETRFRWQQWEMEMQEKSEFCSVGWLGAMGFRLHAYHLKRQTVKCSLLVCTPCSIFASVSLLLTWGEVDYFGLIVTVWFAVQFSFIETTYVPGSSLIQCCSSTLPSRLIWAAAVMEYNISGVWHCCCNSWKKASRGERGGVWVNQRCAM